MSLVTDVADAVTVEINAAPGGTFSVPFEAKRRVLPQFDLEDLATLRVTVVPKRVEISGATRAASQYQIAVDIGVQQKLAPAPGSPAPGSPNADIDTQVAQLGVLVDEIAAYMKKRPLMSFPGILWVSTVNDPVYAPEHLAEQRVFTSVLTLTYQSMK